MCLFSVIVTYVIVIKQIHFKNRTTIKNFTVAKFLKDENAQYFILSVWFYLVSYKIGKVSGALYSFVIYSIFHILSYFQSNILAYLSIGIQQEQKINNLIKRFVSQFNQYALMMAANSEIFIVISLALYSPLLMLRIFSQLPYIVIHFATLAIMIGFLKLRPKYKYDSVGDYDKLVSSGHDMNQSGLTEYMTDVIYFTWILDITVVALGSNKVWYLLLIIPGYAAFKLSGFIKGFFPSKQQQPEQASLDPQKPEGKSKRQQKLEKNGRRKILSTLSKMPACIVVRSHVNGPVEEKIVNKLLALNPTTLKVFNDSHKHSHHRSMQEADNTVESHFRIEIVSEEFKGKGLPNRHRIIYKLLDDEIKIDKYTADYVAPFKKRTS
ncbi:hypothetical protein PSN45_004448 [Yamadazyma tenuis]|uniref:uncharacterized protein n=1 Tax=Candida tenuis TaxID=2315449 RepID=UPI0027A5345E|nr:hypothetical protein PSN45_004448 [Yamadazyma tenuis]